MSDYRGQATEVFFKYQHKGMQDLNAEQQADCFINIGNFPDAKDALVQGIKQRPHNDRLLTKLITFPFLELNWRNTHSSASSPELLEDAEAVHGDLGSFLEINLDKLSAEKNGTDAYACRLGTISELAILALGARHYNNTSESLIIPSTYNDDHSQEFATDMHLVHMDKSKPGRRIQVKTKRTLRSQVQYKDSIAVIGINDLDSFGYSRPANPSSLFRVIVSELNGTMNHYGEGLLQKATDTVLQRTKTVR